MADHQLHPEETIALIREINAQRGGMRHGGADPLPPPPPGPAAEEPPLPDEILEEMELIRRGGFPADGESKSFVDPPEGDLQTGAGVAARPWVGTLAGPSGLVSPTVLAIRFNGESIHLITSAGEVELSVPEWKAMNLLCGRILKRRMREVLKQVNQTYG